MEELKKNLLKKRKASRAIYISSYIPRKCGIATYTKDLTNAINLLNPYALAEILAVNKAEEQLDYPWEVKFKLAQNDLNSYLQAAEYINQSSSDIVSLQHEFGLHGGHCGEYIIPLVESIKKPLVITCHTVIDNPDNEYGVVLKRLISGSKAVVVMMKESAQKLIEKYKFPKNKIAVIPHGTPDLPYSLTEENKRRRKLSGRIILGNINLISEIKGLEYTLEAVSVIAKKYPNVLYLIIGQTHPVVLQYEGEKYRNFLKEKIRKLGIGKNVRFVNKYISLDELINWLKVIDIYVTPYLDPQQSASGALAYAIGAGKTCISTPYLYAKEVLDDGRGVLIPFRDSQSIASSVIELWENPEKRKIMENKAYSFGRLMTWSNVALQHLDLFETQIRRNKC